MDAAGELLGLLEGAAAPGDARVARAWEDLSDRYRRGRGTPGGAALTADHVRAYAVARAPATFAAVTAVLDALRERRPGWEPTSVLDVGAGPGVATWAAAEAFPSLRSAAAVERSPAMVDLARQLAAEASLDAVRQARWAQGEASSVGAEDAADLVVASYVLSELDEDRLDAAVDAWWAATAGELAVVDTGTPAGFARVRRARDRLLAAGATLTAPCPGDTPCPMAGGDWCHFSARLDRTRAHRLAKGAEKGWEDEKLSYVVASRRDPAPAAARVLRHPQVRSGHVRFTLCRDGRVDALVVAKSRKRAFRWARHAAWGDPVPPDVLP